MSFDLSRSRELLERNARWIPGGLASLNRRAEPCVSFERGLGAHVWDVDGNRYIDFHFGFAPYLLGHNDPDVNAAVVRAIGAGTSNFGSGTTRAEGELAELFLDCVRGAGGVQFLNTGSEATAHAIRIARAATGRAHVLKVQGGYNGHHNAVATNLMSDPASLGGAAAAGREYPRVPITAGVPEEEAALTHAVEFNDLAAVEASARQRPLAILILEPCLQNIGVVRPEPGYLEGLRALADRHGFVLCFDEVKTGFRASLGGYQAVSGVVPDLSCWGKAIANGYPLAAVAGRRDLLDLALHPDPARRVLIAGTYNSHPVALAAALATLRKLRDPGVAAYERLGRISAVLEGALRGVFAARGVRCALARVESAWCAYFMEMAPRNWWELATAHDFVFDLELRRALLPRGVYHIPLAAKQGSLCLAHTEADIEETAAAYDDALRSLRQKFPGVVTA